MKYILINKKLLKAAALLFFTIIIAIGANAAGGGPGGAGDVGGDADAPIDGGLSLALAAGAGYLVKRRHDAKKKKAEQDKQILP